MLVPMACYLSFICCERNESLNLRRVSRILDRTMVTLLTNSEKFDGPKILASLNDTDYEQVEMNSLKK